MKRRRAHRAKGWTASRVVTGEYGAVRCKAQGGARASSSGRHIAESGTAVAGPGLRVGRAANALEVAATGSYEGSLSMEGIPDRRKRRPLRGGVESGLGGSLTQGTRRRTQKVAGGYSKEAARAKARETEGKSGRRQGCQRLGFYEHRGSKYAHACERGR